MDEDREQRMLALRERVKAKKTANLTGQVTVQAEAGEEEMVVSQTLVEAEQANDEWMEMLDRDADRWRNLAATLILLGSILGIISGALILQGNPSELLNTSLFAEQESVDISGTALEDVDGSGVEGVTVQLLEEGSRILLQEAVTDQFGHYTMDNVKQDVHLIVFSKTGYETVERTFLPDNVGLDPVTMKPGEGTRYENNEQRVDGWTLDNAVALSSAIGLITVIAALFGIQSAVEIRRGKHYRRSQYLAGLALFSRGLIIVGPALILFGMVINVFARDDFEDRRED
ncbi:MAG: carboxypeptidase regulatory-like domain-containing protein [Poseidonia sp.]|jgi:hypothetical protein